MRVGEIHRLGGVGGGLANLVYAILGLRVLDQMGSRPHTKEKR